MESLKAAVYNGADEVYLGVKDFNARNIEGFSLQTLKDAVDFAHVFNVKVNLAVNILFNDAEMQSALDLVVDAYNLGINAFIVQDVGLASLINKYYPQIEMHASTQMGIHNLEGVREIEKLGFKRVVLARETPLEEIRTIKSKSNIEIEYFCQGALCVSFSGNCYMSSYLHEASGNRGKCKQLCRLPYSFRYNNKELKSGFLLSAKDFNMLEQLEELKQAGVDVLKIEGRARRPFYVGVATKIYKNALSGEKYNIEDLKLAFNRGYTEGYFNGNDNIISHKQNHVGIEIGKVKKVKLGKKFNEVFISSDREISLKSVLKFFKGDKETVLTAYDVKKQDNLYKITTTQSVEVGASVNLISDFEKEQNFLQKTLRRKVYIDVIAKINEPIKASFVLNDVQYSVKGEVCVEAKSQPLTENDLKINFNKSDLFDAEILCKLDCVFLPKQKLNEFRRKVFNKFFEILTATCDKKLDKVTINQQKNIKKFKNYKEIFNLNEKYDADNIIYCPQNYNLNDVTKFMQKCKEENKKGYLSLPNFALNSDVEMLNEIIKQRKIPIVVNNFYALQFNTEKIIGGGMNVFNSYSANYLNLPYLQSEDGEYTMPFMTLRHCPMKEHLNGHCSNCSYKDGYEYVMQSGKRFKLKRIKMSTCTFYLKW